MGRTVGSCTPPACPRSLSKEHPAFDLETLAKLAGARIGLLRVMSETQLQAATDGLTGLLNRRSFEQKVAALLERGGPLSLAMADLDHFKALNDTYGHATGDRALVLFAEILRSSFRSQDVIGRHGGEEFVIALPTCTALNAQKFLDALRSRLDAAITVAGLPRFTASSASSRRWARRMSRASSVAPMPPCSSPNVRVATGSWSAPPTARRPAPARRSEHGGGRAPIWPASGATTTPCPSDRQGPCPSDRQVPPLDRRGRAPRPSRPLAPLEPSRPLPLDAKGGLPAAA